MLKVTCSNTRTPDETLVKIRSGDGNRFSFLGLDKFAVKIGDINNRLCLSMNERRRLQDGYCGCDLGSTYHDVLWFC